MVGPSSINEFRDSSLFIEGLVPKRNWLNERNFLIEKGWVNIFISNVKVG